MGQLTQKIKYPQVTKLVNNVSGLKRNIGVNMEFGIAKKIHKMNVNNRTLEQLPKDFRFEMGEFFKKDIELLSKLIERDLSKWSIA